MITMIGSIFGKVHQTIQEDGVSICNLYCGLAILTLTRLKSNINWMILNLILWPEDITRILANVIFSIAHTFWPPTRFSIPLIGGGSNSGSYTGIFFLVLKHCSGSFPNCSVYSPESSWFTILISILFCGLCHIMFINLFVWVVFYVGTILIGLETNSFLPRFGRYLCCNHQYSMPASCPDILLGSY